MRDGLANMVSAVDILVTGKVVRWFWGKPGTAPGLMVDGITTRQAEPRLFIRLEGSLSAWAIPYKTVYAYVVGALVPDDRRYIVAARAVIASRGPLPPRVRFRAYGVLRDIQASPRQEWRLTLRTPRTDQGFSFTWGPPAPPRSSHGGATMS